MSLPWKILLALAVVLPLGGFVAGSLASTANDEPPARQPIVLDDASTTPPTPRHSEGVDPTPRPSDDRDDDRDDDRHDDDQVEEITPQPYEDDDDDRHGGDDGDDGGEDDSDDGDDGGDDDGGDD